MTNNTKLYCLSAEDSYLSLADKYGISEEVEISLSLGCPRMRDLIKDIQIAYKVRVYEENQRIMRAQIMHLRDEISVLTTCLQY